MGILYEFFFRRTCRGICLEISMVFWFDLIYSYTDLELRLIQFLRKPGGADETLRNWTCDACHAVGFTLAPGTTRLVRQAQRHAWCWMGNSRLMELLFFVSFKGHGEVQRNHLFLFGGWREPTCTKEHIATSQYLLGWLTLCLVKRLGQGSPCHDLCHIY